MAFFLSIIISCEEDFTDIGTSIVTNSEFTTGDTLIQIEISGKDIERVRADGIEIGGVLGQYLLGVYNNSDYEKIEASIISQLQITNDLTLVDNEYGADTTVVTTIDTVFLTLPYQASAIGIENGLTEYRLDSIIGNVGVPSQLNVYRLNSFLNTLDPQDPSQQNSFQSDETYDLDPTQMNVFADAPLVPMATDTVQTVIRKLSNGIPYETETFTLSNNVPFLSIPLKKELIKQWFFDQYETDNFSSQDAFNNYFRGIKIQAEGNDGSLVSFNFNNPNLRPAIQIFYTNTVLKSGTTVIDTIKKSDSYLLDGVRNNQYKMTAGNAPQFGNFPIQGAAGTMAQIKVLGDDNDNNGIADQLEALRTKEWLINDATLTLYVNQNIVRFDTIATPFRLFVYKDGVNNNEPNPSQVLDYVTEGEDAVSGDLSLDSDKRPDKYTFKITDYISELVSGDIDYLPLLGLKVINPSDLPVNPVDTIIPTYNWNPKAVMLYDQQPINGTRRATLKISYSKKTQQNN
ncbi:DUF4270 family protein [Pseudotenacibaculum sp. MALMAid0570]|uniref:DUF4270 family protein n=1 Tax=Pseudotenacibaculum sp. MALMAid0570 TaxID=3143938 RepID=UPI0032DF1DE7